MVMPKGRTLDMYEPESLRDCVDIPYKKIQVTAALFLTNHEYTVMELAAKLGISRTNARTQIDFLLKHKLIYLCRWDRTRSYAWTAVFKAGNLPDAPSPYTKATTEAKGSEPVPEPVVEETPASNYFHELAQALVPVRSEPELHTVNWNYWHHISGKTNGQHTDR